MNPWMVFLIGVLAGWLIEWIIDWLYWRRKVETRTVVEAVPQSTDELDAARQEVNNLKARLKHCDEILPHQLERINGIGPVIKRRLNKNGISSFAKLAEITPQHLIEIAGKHLRHLVDEEEIIRQAKELAELV